MLTHQCGHDQKSLISPPIPVTLHAIQQILHYMFALQETSIFLLFSRYYCILHILTKCYKTYKKIKYKLKKNN